MGSVLRTEPDLTSCETEPICFPGSVQPAGALLVVDPVQGLIEAASSTCLEVLAVEAHRLVGRTLQSVLGPDASERLLSSDASLGGLLVDVSTADSSWVARASRNPQGRILIDIESGAAEATVLRQRYRRLALTLRTLDDEQELAQVAAQGIRALTGHDRVMIYRFDADWNGEVLGESCDGRLQPYLGLHYPASDIPRQARELFARARVRVIADVDAAPSALLASSDAKTIDLGLSSLRSVSPVHIEYCRNMGVRATLVGSLVVDGILWGLVSCHHCSGPLPVPPADRDALGDLCDDLAAQIGTARLRRRLLRQQRLATLRTQLVGTIRRIDLRALLRQPESSRVLQVMDADGFALVAGDAIHCAGHTPSEDRIRALVQHPRASVGGPVRFASHALAADLDIADDWAGVAGAVVVAVETIPQALMVWFRAERSHGVRWAGDPRHPHHTHADGRISPRQSFATFLERVRGQSLPWAPEELASATDLAALIEIDALREREAFTQTVLDSSPDQLCVLDRKGVVVKVNQAWVQFAQANGAGASAQSAVGLDYRRFCQAAADRASGDGAAQAWTGIAAVLDGRERRFSMDYPCDSPDEQRWFQMVVYPLCAPGEGAVVLHQNITARKQAELALELSERRATAVLEDQTELICRFRSDGTMLYVNQAFCRFFGKSADALTGQRWQPVAWPDDVAAVEAALRSLTPAQPVVTIENRVIAGDGSLRWGQFVNRAFFDAQGSLIEMQSVARDITDRKVMEAELALHRDNLEQLVAERTQALAAAKESAEATLADLLRVEGALSLGLSTRRAAMQSMNDAVLVTDAEGRMLDFNDAFARFYRFPDKASCPTSLEVYRTLFDVYFPNGAQAEPSQWASSSALRGETANAAEFTLRRRDTGETWIASFSYAPIRGEDGRILGAVVSARDVTQERQASAELRQAKESAEAANRAKTAFLATMSHELRTPMNAIMGMTDLALRRATDPRQVDQLGKVKQASRHLLAIINDMLDIARIESERMVLLNEGFQLDGLLENLAAQMRVLRGDRALDCTVRVEPALRMLPLRGDATRLLQVLLNLASNAVKFTQKGFVQVRGFGADETAQRVRLRFEVQDSGIGIAPADRDKVFQPFWQVDSTSTRSVGGTGLGLAVSRQIVKLMGGEIGMQPVPEGGSCFWFTASFDKASGVESAPALHDLQTLQSALRARHMGARILLAEDDPLNREIAVALLCECGLEVDMAIDGREAVASAATLPVDLVLMDVQMPGTNGLDATRQIRRNEVGRRVPIIALTANVFPEDEARCVAAGMDDFIGRPCEPEVLLGAVLKWLDRRLS